VPLNINNVNKNSDGIDVAAASVDTGTASSSNDAKVIDGTRPALLDLTQSGEPSAQDQQSSAVVMTAEDKPAIKTEPEESQQADRVVTEADEPAEEIQLASAAPVANNQDKSDAAEAVKDGWVVRVGTYSKDANVVSVSSLLSKSGYEPNATPVSTSLGPSTRVWLGPFAKRETADQISDKLKALTGEKGYVTRSSS
jgi:cell division septation protein DedD